jgi:hypothetical protein
MFWFSLWACVITGMEVANTLAVVALLRRKDSRDG